MKNFIFYNPTKIVFGESKTQKIGEFLKNKKVLLLYGGGSIKANGIYEKIIDSLNNNNVIFVEKSGIKPNPVLSFVREAIKFARSEKIDAILAVGGGSVIDSAKAIAAGFYYDNDVWDFFVNKATINKALPIYVVLTLSATASEMNSGAVITNEDTKQKFNINADTLFPAVSVLDPVNTYTVPNHQVANGCVDAMIHLLEGYFTKSYENTPIQDGFVEVLLRTIMFETKEILKNPTNYDARANFMWSATLALNGLTTAGIGGYGFPNHMIGHSLSAIYDIAHACSLSIVFPAWLKYNFDSKKEKISQLGKAIFDESDAEATINNIISFFKSIGVPTSLSDANIDKKDIPMIAENAVALAKKWQLNDYTVEVIAKILQLSA